MNSTYELILISPLITLFMFSIIPLLTKVFRNNKEPRPVSVTFWALAGLVSAFGLTAALQNNNSLIFQKAIALDGLSLFTSLCVYVFGAICVLFTSQNPATQGRQYSEHIFLLMNSIVGMVLVASANDLIMLFVGIELMSLCLYALIAMSNEEQVSKESAIKYFVLGSVASAIFLYGVSFIFGAAGTTYFDELAQWDSLKISSYQIFYLGMVMVLAGLCFKVALFPFQSWVPDVYQGAPTPITALMATGVKVVTFAALMRWVFISFVNGSDLSLFTDILQWVAVASLLVGNLAALTQKQLKRMLAYSGLAHSGYVLVGLIAVTASDSFSAGGVLFYLASYGITTLAALGLVHYWEEKSDQLIEITQLKGLSQQRPWLAICAALALLSLAGIPPLLGFFAKFFVIAGALQKGFFWLAGWAVLASVISLYYYLKPVVYMYFYEQDDQSLSSVIPENDFWKNKGASWVVISFCSVLILLGGFMVNPIYSFIEQTMQN